MAGDSANEARMVHVENEIKEHRKTVTEQGQILAVLANSISKIEHYMEESIKIQKEQAVLFERFTNYEEKNSDEHSHIHNRIDETNTRCAKIEARCESIETNHRVTYEAVTPMAKKGESVHAILVRTAWGLGTMIGLMLFYMVIWGIKASDYKP